MKLWLLSFKFMIIKCLSGPTIQNRFQKTAELAGIDTDKNFIFPITSPFLTNWGGVVSTPFKLCSKISILNSVCCIWTGRKGSDTKSSKIISKTNGNVTSAADHAGSIARRLIKIIKQSTTTQGRVVGDDARGIVSFFPVFFPIFFFCLHWTIPHELFDIFIILLKKQENVFFCWSRVVSPKLSQQKKQAKKSRRPYPLQVGELNKQLNHPPQQQQKKTLRKRIFFHLFLLLRGVYQRSVIRRLYFDIATRDGERVRAMDPKIINRSFLGTSTHYSAPDGGHVRKSKHSHTYDVEILFLSPTTRMQLSALLHTRKEIGSQNPRKRNGMRQQDAVMMLSLSVSLSPRVAQTQKLMRWKLILKLFWRSRASLPWGILLALCMYVCITISTVAQHPEQRQKHESLVALRALTFPRTRAIGRSSRSGWRWDTRCPRRAAPASRRWPFPGAAGRRHAAGAAHFRTAAAPACTRSPAALHPVWK